MIELSALLVVLVSSVLALSANSLFYDGTGDRYDISNYQSNWSRRRVKHKGNVCRGPGCRNADRSIADRRMQPNRRVMFQGAEEFPWLARVYYENYGHYRCAGVVINRVTVLTIADCIDDGSDEILLEIYSDAPEKKQRRKVKDLECDSDFNPYTMENNLCVLSVDQEWDLDPSVSLPKLPVKSQEPFVDMEAIAVSWESYINASTIHARSICKQTVQTLSNDACIGSGTEYDSVTKRMICSISAQEEECQVDGGGALLQVQDGQPKLIGLVTGNKEDCSGATPSVYMRLTPYLTWLEDFPRTTSPPSTIPPTTIPPSTITPSTIPPTTIPPPTAPPSTAPPSTIAPLTEPPSTTEVTTITSVSTSELTMKPTERLVHTTERFVRMPTSKPTRRPEKPTRRPKKPARRTKGPWPGHKWTTPGKSSCGHTAFLLPIVGKIKYYNL